jgi:hypothetical protein
LVSDLSDNSPLEDDPTIVIFSSNCVVRVYNAVSPDGDGLNDFLLIEGLDCYSTNMVQIFDRWGESV